MSKEIKTRLLTPTEQKYTYAQSMSDTSRLLWKGSRTGLEMWKALTLLQP